MKVLLDIYLEKNLGDDLFLASVLKRYPQHEFYTFTQMDYSDYEAEFSNLKIIKYNKYYNYLMVKTGQKNNLIKRFIKANKIDALASIGGSIFIEHEGWETNYKLRKELWNYFSNLGKPVYIIGSNFGPYTDEAFLDAYRSLLATVTDVCFRDEASYNLFKDLKNIRIAPDAIFSYKLKHEQIEENSLGISVIDLKNRPDLAKYSDEYETKLVNIIYAALDAEKKIYLYSYCKAEGDEVAIERIKNTYFADNAQVIPYFYEQNLGAFMKKFSRMESMIATRFHSIVLSMVLDIPFFAINYSKKSDNLLNDLDVPVQIKHIQKLSEVEENHIFDYMNRKDDISKIVENAEKQFAALDLLLSKS
ncbi:polysaccharide pyruvyl transferase family protein [Aerococcus urinaeequi]|uniref:polysaccharide pyruvyl transferase family protein n=1 Tax=Aerococcus urinaeequi TaxID=51665 RepID=UPI0022E7A20A|nr:polysaccharide pyruvyl transferase family protein [Aerococcus urinaeequi]